MAETEAKQDPTCSNCSTPRKQDSPLELHQHPEFLAAWMILKGMRRTPRQTPGQFEPVLIWGEIDIFDLLIWVIARSDR